MNYDFMTEVEKAKDYLVIVEGKKDKYALQYLGFNRIFVINETGKSLGESKKDGVCILTDFDRKGKKMYLLLKSKLSELGVRMDNSFRGFLLKQRISHIEGLLHFLERGGNERMRDKKLRKRKNGR